MWVFDRFGPKVEMPVSIYFREESDFPLLEKIALRHCEGSVLDIGAGAGAHSLYLQEKGLDVTSLEISAASVSVMRDRGIQNVVCGDFFEIDLPQYDTLLLLMNGIGLCGTMDKVAVFLNKAKTLLKENGKIVFDSSDIQYMYEDILLPEHYYGEIAYQYAYKRLKTNWFNWLYIDKNKMMQVAQENGWEMQVIFEDDNDQYLAELRCRNK